MQNTPSNTRGPQGVCTGAVLVGVMRLASWAALPMVPGAWYMSCADELSFGLIVDVSSLLFSVALPGVWSFPRETPRDQHNIIP